MKHQQKNTDLRTAHLKKDKTKQHTCFSPAGAYFAVLLRRLTALFNPEVNSLPQTSLHVGGAVRGGLGRNAHWPWRRWQPWPRLSPLLSPPYLPTLLIQLWEGTGVGLVDLVPTLQHAHPGGLSEGSWAPREPVAWRITAGHLGDSRYLGCSTSSAMSFQGSPHLRCFSSAETPIVVNSSHISCRWHGCPSWR